MVGARPLWHDPTIRNPKQMVDRNARAILVLGSCGHWMRMCPNCGRGLSQTSTMGATHHCSMCGAYWFIACVAHDPTVDERQGELNAWTERRKENEKERQEHPDDFCPTCGKRKKDD